MSPAVCAARDEHSLLPLRRPHCAAASAGAEPITIYLTAPGLAATPMRVMASDSIAAVKLRVQTSHQTSSRSVKLVFDGRELARNDSRVRDYGVGDGTVLHLVIRVADLRLIVVETAHGGRFRFRVEPGRTVGHVKQRVAREYTLLHHPPPPAAQHPDDGHATTTLVLEGEELDDRRLIHDVCKADGAVVHLLLVRAENVEVSVADALQYSQPQQEAAVAKHVGVEPVVVNPKARLPPALQDLVGAALAGMESGKAPIMSSEGTGGAYFMQDASGDRHVAVFKPADEEPMAANNPRGLPASPTGEGLKKGTRVGEGALREVAAYLLDHPLVGGRRSSLAGHGAAAAVGFAGVPPTALVRCVHERFRYDADGAGSPVFKLGSLQAFVNNCGSCEDMGPRAFPVQEVHKISVLDIRLTNADRHAGNILVCKDEAGISLVPIDHGYCLPESFEDCTFEWLYWPQSRQPFNKETVEYIESLDAEEDIAILRFHGWEISGEVARTLRVATMLLKKGTERGLTAFDLGSIMCRETLTKESAIEEMVREAQDGAADDEDAFLQAVSEIMDRRLDQLSSDRK